MRSSTIASYVVFPRLACACRLVCSASVLKSPGATVLMVTLYGIS